ncbi:hypothetical protein SERLA73DRAFT_142927 [Serpula lacrymans var. lacrymans S7.3]|uniref:Uncharacterized protein n=2 Tax=Serpula lacrymans var. lacrymans TaxID=341189 RepID=F8Q8M8_SERL3|nr:uncharacterized protein SERLADRAFT_399244 [Serpula lacrymans var. lacrymans S7.9]EGN94933.1 hypothetical protein SERLA73DRAFT_142927 [Serpula lacrymans var. lacrymans S7.3]EGO20428.1 hypothetical protein SERLADRAFT_399244 [Serpula lacrymans var. lacrymans S7.9]
MKFEIPRHLVDGALEHRRGDSVNRTTRLMKRMTQLSEIELSVNTLCDRSCIACSS